MRGFIVSFLTIALSSVIVSSCSKPQSVANGASTSPESFSIQAAAPKEAGEITNTAIQKPSSPLIAYKYLITIQLPQNSIAKTVNENIALCEKAGMDKCQIISSNISNSESSINATVSIRAEPNFLKTFRTQIESNAKNNGGKITGTETSSEDLTISITDKEAKLRAETLLRERLEKIIASNPGKLSDLLEAERELARVQGEIDSITSIVAIERGRVNMSELEISYTTDSNSIMGNNLSPIKNALSDFLHTVANSLSILIYIIAALLPFAIILIPLIWFIAKQLKKRKAAKLEAQKETIS